MPININRFMNPIKRKRSNIENCNNFLDKLEHKGEEILALSKEVNDLLSEYSFTFGISKANCLEDLENQLEKEFSEIARLKEINELKLLAELDEKLRAAYISYVNNCDELYIKISDFIQKLKFDSKYLYSIGWAEKWTDLWVYDIEKDKRENKVISTPEPLSNGTCIVQLPNSELFCYGNSFFSGISCIIDLETFTVKKLLPYGSPSWCCGAVYYKNCVYFFGGWDKQNYMLFAEKFDLAGNRWLKSPKLPEASSGCSCVLFQECIYICGFFHSKVYKYDLEIESYSNINFPVLCSKMSKLLFSGNSRLYLIQEPGILFESDYGSEYAWSKIGAFNLKWNYSAFRKKVNQSVFISFISYNCMSCFKFDLVRKSLEKLAR
ncbi:unnamed protein product [Blepharisma stoltei]|uniref:Uncharacterized protein n=1 Tax=Blepharisma stoltei TaxID=1481888 RepID=A0AAU9IA18_9CILI|nr:unnamed protein product [Blepharisma stoltei]